VTTTPGEVPPVLIREATPADLAALRDLIATNGLPLDGLDDAADVCVADAAGTIVSTAALEWHGTGDNTTFLLRSAAVDSVWRDRGVGAGLTAAALAHVDQAGAPVALLTETATDYFPRLGIAPVDRDQLPVALTASAELRGACPASAHALLRPVTHATEGR
jgi:amino-acid N-acetyltransferase